MNDKEQGDTTKINMEEEAKRRHGMPRMRIFNTMDIAPQINTCWCTAGNFNYGTVVLVRNSLPSVETIQITWELSGKNQ